MPSFLFPFGSWFHGDVPPRAVIPTKFAAARSPGDGELQLRRDGANDAELQGRRAT